MPRTLRHRLAATTLALAVPLGAGLLTTNPGLLAVTADGGLPISGGGELSGPILIGGEMGGPIFTDPFVPIPLPPPALVLGQKVPNVEEVVASGAITAKIQRNTADFDRLVTNTNPDIVFKNEENSDANPANDNTDPLMQPELKARLDALAVLVKNELPGLKLRVTEAFDLDDEHTGASLHYEGRAADITVSDRDQSKLGRLGQLAVDAGFEWVWYEAADHVHVSVPKPPPPPARQPDMPDYTEPGRFIRPTRPGFYIP